MLVTITNASATETLNKPATYETVPSAVGGALENPLPYPFDLVDAMAPPATVQRAVHPADFRYDRYRTGSEPAREWNRLIQEGLVTMAVAAETGFRDAEEAFIATV